MVGLEPSCVSVFRDEITNLLGPDEDAKRLKEQTYLLTEFLAKKAPEYTPPRLHRKALVQQHCHHKAILDVDEREASYSPRSASTTKYPTRDAAEWPEHSDSMRGHYEVSMALGERALLPKVRAADKETIVVADGFSCREQISADDGSPGDASRASVADGIARSGEAAQ